MPPFSIGTLCDKGVHMGELLRTHLAIGSLHYRLAARVRQVGIERASGDERRESLFIEPAKARQHLSPNEARKPLYLIVIPVTLQDTHLPLFPHIYFSCHWQAFLPIS